MKGKKIITILVIINILFIGIIYNLININYFKNNKQIVKHMTETGNESQIEELNKSYQNYREYIDSSKKQLATAITNKGVETTSDSTLETMTANVNKIVTNPPASLISYDNTSSGLKSTNVQNAVDEINDSLGDIDYSKFTNADKLYEGTITIDSGKTGRVLDNIDFTKYKAISISNNGVATHMILTSVIQSYMNLTGASVYRILDTGPIYVNTSNKIEPYYAMILIDYSGNINIYSNQYSFATMNYELIVYGYY